MISAGKHTHQALSHVRSSVVGNKTGFVANVVLFPLAKEFWKLVKIWWSYQYFINLMVFYWKSACNCERYKITKYFSLFWCYWYWVGQEKMDQFSEFITPEEADVERQICISKCSVLYLKENSCFKIYHSHIFFALDKWNHTILKITNDYLTVQVSWPLCLFFRILDFIEAVHSIPVHQNTYYFTLKGVRPRCWISLQLNILCRTAL